MSCPREREKRDGRDSRGDERVGQGRKRKINESEETEEKKNQKKKQKKTPLPLLAARVVGLAQL